MENFREDSIEDANENYQLRYVRVYFHVYGEESSDLNETDHFFKNLKFSKAEFMTKIRQEVFKTV